MANGDWGGPDCGRSNSCWGCLSTVNHLNSTTYATWGGSIGWPNLPQVFMCQQFSSGKVGRQRARGRNCEFFHESARLVTNQYLKKVYVESSRRQVPHRHLAADSHPTPPAPRADCGASAASGSTLPNRKIFTSCCRISGCGEPGTRSAGAFWLQCRGKLINMNRTWRADFGVGRREVYLGRFDVPAVGTRLPNRLPFCVAANSQTAKSTFTPTTTPSPSIATRPNVRFSAASAAGAQLVRPLLNHDRCNPSHVHLQRPRSDGEERRSDRLALHAEGGIDRRPRQGGPT